MVAAVAKLDPQTALKPAQVTMVASASPPRIRRVLDHVAGLKTYQQRLAAAAGGLKQLPVTPALTATARFGLVTLAQRTPPPAIDQVRWVMQQTLRDPTYSLPRTRRATKAG